MSWFKKFWAYAAALAAGGFGVYVLNGDTLDKLAPGLYVVEVIENESPKIERLEKPNPTPEPHPEPDTHPEPHPTPEPHPSPEPHPTPEPHPSPQPQPTPEPSPSPKPEPPTPSTGWLFDRSTAPVGNKIYVASNGNDSNPGTEAQPLRTVSAGHNKMRQGQSDWLMLRCGDVWKEDLSWDRGGSSNTNRAVLTYYGDTTKGRPQIHSLSRIGGSGRQPRSNWAVVGVKFQIDSRNPTNGVNAPNSNHSNVGLRLMDGIENVLIEDCYFRWFNKAITLEAYGSTKMRNVVFNRCIILDSYSNKVDDRPSGVYSTGVHGQQFLECIADRNGWQPNNPEFGRTIYNHNFYLDVDEHNVNARVGSDSVVRGCILSNASSHGTQMRCGGTVERNFFYKNPINYFIGGSKNGSPRARGIRNLITAGINMVPARPNSGDTDRVWGMNVDQSSDGLYQQNMILDAAATGQNAAALLLSSGGNTRVENTLIRDWPRDDHETASGVTVTGTKQLSGGASVDSIVRSQTNETNTDVWIDWHRNRGLQVWDESKSAAGVCDRAWNELK